MFIHHIHAFTGNLKVFPIAALFIFHLTMTKEAKVWALQPTSEPMGVGCQSCLLLELRRRENVCGFVYPLSSRIHLRSISRVSRCQQNMTWLCLSCTRLFCIMWAASIHIITAVEMTEEEHSKEHENYESQHHPTGGINDSHFESERSRVLEYDKVTAEWFLNSLMTLRCLLPICGSKLLAIQSLCQLLIWVSVSASVRRIQEASLLHDPLWGSNVMM